MPVTKRSSGAAGRRRVDDQQERIRDRADERECGEEPPRIDAVRQAEHRAGDAADDEARLHAAGQRGLHEVREPVLATSAGTTADAENHNAIAATWQSAMIADRRALGLAPGHGVDQIFGSVTPC